MKISLNNHNSFVNTKEYAFLKPVNKINKTSCSFMGITDRVTKVNLTDSKTGEKIQADLIEKPFNGLLMKQEIRVENKLIGIADVSISPSIANVPKRYRDNGFLYVNSMENLSNGRYKGIGTELLKSVVKRSERYGYEGRVALTAAKNAHVFHYKFGFEPVKGGIEGGRIKKTLIEESKKKNPYTEYLCFVDMYLPEKRIAEILCE